MMNIEFDSLILQCRKDRVKINLTHQISFFHGQIGSGKSSIVRLIDFTLGGKLEYTPALRQEMVSATLNAKISQYEAIFERQADHDAVQVTWQNEKGKGATVLAPIKAQDNPIWKDTIFNLSDLLFHLMGMQPPRVLKSKIKEETTTVRLSFRDFMWYCYLDQDHLDSSFFRLEDTYKSNKSKDIIKFIVGFQSERLGNLEANLVSIKEERAKARNSAKELRQLLEKLGYESIGEVEDRMRQTRIKLDSAKTERDKLQKNYRSETHQSDDLRQNLRGLVKEVVAAEEALEDLKVRLEEQKSLRSELLSSKFKLARSMSVANVLDNVKFDLCPSCGSDVAKRFLKKDECYLCQSPMSSKPQQNVESLRLDIDSRIQDLENSINIHTKSFKQHGKLLEKLYTTKRTMDSRLEQELKNYDSAYISKFRQVDRQIATLQERLKSQEALRKLPQEVEWLEERAGDLLGKEEVLKDRISQEKGKLTEADRLVSLLENLFQEKLIKIGFPGISESDKVEINRTTWQVQIVPKRNPGQRWSFEHAGSGGKKTLFNVSYILAIHQLAEENDLPLPNFIIIDTPMKNIGEEVNEDIFKKFYKHLYDLATSSLSRNQFIIIDKDFILPTHAVDFYNRYMTPNDPDHPPLIPYYSGS